MTEDRKELPKHRSRRLRASILVLVGTTLAALSITFWILLDYQVLLVVQADPTFGPIIDPAYPLVPLLLGVLLVVVGWQKLPRRSEAWPSD